MSDSSRPDIWRCLQLLMGYTRAYRRQFFLVAGLSLLDMGLSAQFSLGARHEKLRRGAGVSRPDAGVSRPDE